MNKLRFYIGILALLITTSILSCLDDNEDTFVEFKVSKEEMSVTKEGGEMLLYVQSEGSVRIISDALWCMVSEEPSTSQKTHKFLVKIEQNETTEERTATLTVEGGEMPRTVKIIQEAGTHFVVAKTDYDVSAEGETITVELATSGEYSYQIKDESWIHPTSARNIEHKTMQFVIDANYLSVERTGTITFTMANIFETVTVRQAGREVSPADKTGMDHDATALAKKIVLGWNLGNVMECTPGGESAWGNPKASKALIDAVKAAGFNAVRIPCAWDQYIENPDTYQIKAAWLARVKEVVDYCLDNDMYAILNIHWDNGWLENNPTYDKQEAVNKKQTALWQQIASYFSSYDEHLLFAGTNEVHVDYNAPTTENIEVQLSFNQTFVDAVRATGGKNVYRNLIVQSYNTNAQYAVDYLKMPEDDTANRLMAEIHFYDPWDFAGTDEIKYWGEPYRESGISSWGQEDSVDEVFGKLKSAFVDKGYPVILGEYGANRHSATDARMVESRAYYLKYVTAAAKKNGLVPFYWDNGGLDNGEDQFGLFNRKDNIVFDQPAVDTLMEGAKAGTYPY